MAAPDSAGSQGDISLAARSGSRGRCAGLLSWPMRMVKAYFPIQRTMPRWVRAPRLQGNQFLRRLKTRPSPSFRVFGVFRRDLGLPGSVTIQKVAHETHE